MQRVVEMMGVVLSMLLVAVVPEDITSMTMFEFLMKGSISVVDLHLVRCSCLRFLMLM